MSCARCSQTVGSGRRRSSTERDPEYYGGLSTHVPSEHPAAAHTAPACGFVAPVAWMWLVGMCVLRCVAPTVRGQASVRLRFTNFRISAASRPHIVAGPNVMPRLVRVPSLVPSPLFLARGRACSVCVSASRVRGLRKRPHALPGTRPEAKLRRHDPAPRPPHSMSSRACPPPAPLALSSAS